MAREGLTVSALVGRTQLNHRTIKGLLAGRQQPHSRTLHRLAAGLNVPVEELFQDAALLRHRLFDRRTNPVVEEVVAEHPQVFHGWTEANFDELASRFGAGGALTRDGALAAARAMNRRRELLSKVTLLLETSEARSRKYSGNTAFDQASSPSSSSSARAGKFLFSISRIIRFPLVYAIRIFRCSFSRASGAGV
jgi:transcriptional regulator with XRE-family HTH domain